MGKETPVGRGEKDNKGRRMLAKGEKIVVFQKIHASRGKQPLPESEWPAPKLTSVKLEPKTTTRL